MKQFHELSDYPKLYHWYCQAVSKPPEVSDHASTLLFNTCRALESNLEGRLRVFMHSIEQFFRHTSAGQREFLQAEQLFQDHEVDFFVLTSEIAETALNTAKGPAFQTLMRQVADKSQLSVFRFFSAWTALNLGDLELCIEECEKITDPFACVYTLQGQAFLESGFANEAIEALNLAISISPQEAMTHFQLAKAYYATDDFEKAWNALTQCLKLVPKHPEVQTFMGMVALRIDDKASRDEKLALILPELLELYKEDKQNIDLLYLTLDVVFSRADKDAMESLMGYAPWEEFRTKPKFMSQLAVILRELDKKEWRAISLALLTKLTSQTQSA